MSDIYPDQPMICEGQLTLLDLDEGNELLDYLTQDEPIRARLTSNAARQLLVHDLWEIIRSEITSDADHDEHQVAYRELMARQDRPIGRAH